MTLKFPKSYRWTRPVRNRARWLLSVALLLCVCASVAICAEPAYVMVHGAGRTTGPNPTNPTITATTRPSWPLLHLLSTDGWQPQEAPWPAGIAFDDPDQVSMAVVNEIPTVAINTGDRYIHLLQYSRAAKRWETMKDKV